MLNNRRSVKHAQKGELHLHNITGATECQHEKKGKLNMREYVSCKDDFKHDLWDLTGMPYRRNISTWKIEPPLNLKGTELYINPRCYSCNISVLTPSWYCPGCGALMLNTNSVLELDKRYVKLLSDKQNKQNEQKEGTDDV